MLIGEAVVTGCAASAAPGGASAPTVPGASARQLLVPPSAAPVALEPSVAQVLVPPAAAPVASDASAAPVFVPPAVAPVAPDPSPAEVPVPSTAAAPAAEAVQLTGTWLGPAVGDQGRCGTASAAFVFQLDGRYAYQQATIECGGFTSYGRYRVEPGTIAFHQESVPVCPTCAQVIDFSVSFDLVANSALTICDQARCYTYYRQ
jgi:hypothetical protein